MIPEEYIRFENAKLLKDAGFPQDIKLTMFYNKFGQDYHLADGYYGNGYAMPSQAMAMRWLRENRKISVEPAVTLDELWHVNVWDFDDIKNLHEDIGERYDTYEAAAEAGIQAACKYLISQK